ncbi:diacylglycerol kinase family protein [Robertkochia aurantiaca]|uniref:diacylglycerol kinase family protein n=1 Tax=Robertkochia aurantiaca TaxID=2873700 RepID=UPI001CC93CE8|nr:diacylglycerol kinase family protein [Robertkochia sp. 3YJGBD-33]
MKQFLLKRLKSIRYASKGAYLLLKTEPSIQIQFVIGILVTIAGFVFEISAVEWMIQVLVIAAIMSVEGLNTAVEKIADFIHPDPDINIGFIKDIAAGAVFIIAMAAVVIGLIIYVPKIF